jgi:hypothetical protein
MQLLVTMAVAADARAAADTAVLLTAPQQMRFSQERPCRGSSGTDAVQ